MNVQEFKLILSQTQDSSSPNLKQQVEKYFERFAGIEFIGILEFLKDTEKISTFNELGYHVVNVNQYVSQNENGFTILPNTVLIKAAPDNLPKI